MLESAWVAAGFVLYLLVFVGGWHTRWRWYLLPFLPWLSRSWFLLEPVKELRFLSTTIEGLRGFDGWRGLRDTHLITLLFAVSCFTPALSATTAIGLLNALAFGTGMVLSLGYMASFSRDLDSQVPVADQMLVTFTALAWFYKFAYGYQLGISPLLVRGGGVYASNQYISIAICLLPFVRQRWVLLLAVTTMLLQFSRGGFIALGLLAALSALHRTQSVEAPALQQLVNLRTLAVFVLAVAGGVVLLSFVAPDGFKFLLVRLIGGGAFGLNIDLADRLATLPLSELVTLASESAQRDDRNLIWSTALDIAAANHYVGVGAGSFVVAASALNAELLYSNAHNMYLTLLSELGLAPCLLFVSMLLVHLVRAYRCCAPAFAALSTFAIYGLFSGQIYETSSEASIAQFIVLLFVFSTITTSNSHRAC